MSEQTPEIQPEQPKLLPPPKPKEYTIHPTGKQKSAYQIFTDNHGRLSMYECMIEAGYTPETASSPQRNLINSRGWQELLEKYLPDEALLDSHVQLLNAKRVKKVFMKGALTEVIEEEDTFARTKALEMAYKVKGKLVEKKELKANLTITALVAELSDD